MRKGIRGQSGGAGTVLLVLVVIVIACGLFGLSMYNGLIAKHENVSEQWSQVNTQLQRRTDLIPNLVSTVKGYAKHEEKIFTEVSEARSKLLGAKTASEQIAAANAMESALGRLLAIAENYPELKAGENFKRLQDELAGTENRIAVARTRYNEIVKDFNRSIQQFPHSFFAKMLKYEKADYFAPSAGEAAVQEVPKVSF